MCVIRVMVPESAHNGFLPFYYYVALGYWLVLALSFFLSFSLSLSLSLFPPCIFSLSFLLLSFSFSLFCMSFYVHLFLFRSIILIFTSIPLFFYHSTHHNSDLIHWPSF